MIHLIKKRYIYDKLYIKFIYPGLYTPKFFQFKQKHYHDMINIRNNFDRVKWLFMFIGGSYIKNTIKQHIPKKTRRKKNENI